MSHPFGAPAGNPFPVVGQVTDQNGLAASSITISLTNTPKGYPAQTAVTDAGGYYSITLADWSELDALSFSIDDTRYGPTYTTTASSSIAAGDTYKTVNITLSTPSIRVQGAVTDGGTAQASLTVAFINIDNRTTGATGRVTGTTDASGNYDLTLDGKQYDEMVVVVQDANPATKAASSRWYLTSTTSYTRDLTLLSRRAYVRGVIVPAKLKVTAL